MALISIVAPCLNEERYLPTFFRGLQHQTFSDFEVIIVDGGSKDRSLEIVDRFSSQLLKKGIRTRLITDRTRNLGYIRNVGGDCAEGKITIQCNTDNYFEPELLEKINHYYQAHSNIISLSGRVFPLGSNIIAHIGYQLFDLLRYLFTRAPTPFRKYRPSGNFTSFLTGVWYEVGGYPEVPVNEDGLLGERLDRYAKEHGRSLAFRLDLYVGHYVKKFEQMGGIQALLFYFYTLGNFSTLLKKLLAPIERSAALVFQGKQMERQGIFSSLWNWL